jgi:hypothetical protein
MELPHCSAMWWQHSRSAGVIVAPGRTQAMAGVIAHNTATVSSANARVRVTLTSLPRFGNAIDTKVLLPIEILDHVAFNCCDRRHTFCLPYRADFRGKHVQVLVSGVPAVPVDDRCQQQSHGLPLRACPPSHATNGIRHSAAIGSAQVIRQKAFATRPARAMMDK